MERGEKTQSQLLVASSFFLGEKKNEKTKSNKFGEEKGKTFPLPFLPYSTKQKQMCKKSMGSFFLLDSSQQFLNSPSIHPLLFPSIYFTALRPLTFDLQFHFEPISSDFSFPILGRGGGEGGRSLGKVVIGQPISRRAKGRATRLLLGGATTSLPPRNHRIRACNLEDRRRSCRSSGWGRTVRDICPDSGNTTAATWLPSSTPAR